MNIIEKIKERLWKYPQLRYEATEHSVVVYPMSESGFEVSLYLNQDSIEPYNVFFEGWHEAFSSESEALNCFAYCLSSECRLKEYSRGDEPYKWTVEHKREGRWEQNSTTTTLVSVLFWKTKKVRYLQNELAI